MSVEVRFALTLALSAIPIVAICDPGRSGKPVSCRIDRDCSSYYRCNPERVCAVPPAVLGQSDVRTPRLELVAGELSRGRFFVELARDGFERARGLSHRPGMAVGWGMLFIYPRAVQHAFTMAQMRFPLDMLFMDGSGKVVDIIEDAQPKELVLNSSKAYRYVLELNAGTVRARGVRIGDSMRLDNIPRRYLPLDG